MASSVSVCSNALVMLGDETISSFDEANDRARICANLYPQILEATIRAHQWDCCTKRVLLAPLAQAPAFGWAYQYQIPSDCMRILTDGYEGNRREYVVEGRQILSNNPSLQIRYLFRNDDGDTWDAGFVDVLTHAVAAYIAYAITQSDSVAGQAMQKYQMMLARARVADGQQGFPEQWSSSPFITCRG